MVGMAPVTLIDGASGVTHGGQTVVVVRHHATAAFKLGSSMGGKRAALGKVRSSEMSQKP